MKLITLNIWGGRVSDKLESFFKTHNDIDVWFFQEVYRLLSSGPVDESMIQVEGFTPNPDLFQSLKSYLPAHNGEFCQTFRDAYGIATFLKSDISIIDKGETFVARGDWSNNEDTETKDHHRKIQWLELKVGDKPILLVNAHLTHRPAGKVDSEKRIKQSKIIIDFLEMFDCPKILAGDFNLLPDTESIKLIEKLGMRNLIKEHNITSTRTELYKKDVQFADYVFVSPEIKVNDFKVLPDVVSDHTPLFLDFEIA